jgi:hypothetical protein
MSQKTEEILNSGVMRSISEKYGSLAVKMQQASHGIEEKLLNDVSHISATGFLGNMSEASGSKIEIYGFQDCEKSARLNSIVKDFLREVSVAKGGSLLEGAYGDQDRSKLLRICAKFLGRLEILQNATNEKTSCLQEEWFINEATREKGEAGDMESDLETAMSEIRVRSEESEKKALSFREKTLEEFESRLRKRFQLACQEVIGEIEHEALNPLEKDSEEDEKDTHEQKVRKSFNGRHCFLKNKNINLRNLSRKEWKGGSRERCRPSLTVK